MRISNWVLTGFFAALIVAFSQIQIPLPMIPINMALLAVYLSGALLPRPYGLLAVLCYILMGIIGLPVFAGLQGGVAVLLSRTGGYILGYIPCVLIVSLAKTKKGGTIHKMLPLGCLIGTIVLYTLGTIWFMRLTRMSLAAALGYCVLPFIPGDGLKILLATLLSKRLRPIMEKDR